MSRIFLSHSSADNAQAIALRDWLDSEGWNDLFLDLDADRGIVAGERWERSLNAAASRCEAVLFLVSKAWLSSRWCMTELNLAHRLNKRLLGILIEDIPVADLPADVTNTWQLVSLASGRDHIVLRAVLPVTHEEVHVTFSAEGLLRVKRGLEQAGLDAKYFAWPPTGDPKRPPYRGLRPLEADDAGIFFGREAPVIKAIDQLRGLRAAAPPRLFVILGASGAGKSSFLRAGLYPRLARDDQNFLPLPIIRPERAVLTGETGLLAALTGAFEAARITIPRAELREAIQGGAAKLGPMLQELAGKATPTPIDGEARSIPPTLVISIDQGEELFLAEAQDEAQPLLALLRDLLNSTAPNIIAAFTIRSDNYERLQECRELEGIPKVPFDLGPMPKGSYAEVIKGPARRLDGTARALKIEEPLVDALLSDIEAGGAKDAMPLLAFTLERLYGEYQAGGKLRLANYEQLGRVKGSIEAAVERAFKAADGDPAIPRDRNARLALLRRGLIPWLAGIDPDTGSPRRRVARLSEIPVEARPLIDHLITQRLLSTDVAKDTGEKTIEPSHEALLRQWGLLQGWLAEDAGLLSVMDGVKRASRDWAANGKEGAWLTHGRDRLKTAESLQSRHDLSGNLEPTDWAYLQACRAGEHAATDKESATLRSRIRMQRAIGLLMLGVIAGLVGWVNQALILEQAFKLRHVYPFVLTVAKERTLESLGAAFKECTDCPEMIAVPAGQFLMGLPHGQGGDDRTTDRERPQHKVTIGKPFAVARYTVTFDEWDQCFALGGCKNPASDSSWGRGRRPAINVSWRDAQEYVAWLSKLTGRPYRLLTDSEWEYAARAGTTTVYSFGDDSKALADFAWFSKNSLNMTHPVGEKKPNPWGLSDVHGNVRQWVEDVFESDYTDAPDDGSARKSEDQSWPRVLRGNDWDDSIDNLRSAKRTSNPPDDRSNHTGFRVARTLRQ